MNYLKFLFTVILYFAISIGFPWEKIDNDNSISFSYLFDFIFIIAISFFMKLKNFKKLDKFSFFAVRVIVTFFIALISIVIIEEQKMPMPFKLIDQIGIKLLILAPILEELVFRHVFFQLGDKAGFGTKFNIYLNAFLFSLSHLPAYWLVPSEYQSFIMIQLFYTFLLGIVCGGAVKEQKLIIYPIFLHFLFNLMFYFAVISVFS
jgi:membrane protease YdiL (CAAX protease family)